MKPPPCFVYALASLLMLGLSASLQASSTAIATGSATIDGRPVSWKNRDHWSTPDGWKVHTYHYAATAPLSARAILTLRGLIISASRPKARQALTP